MVGSQGYAEILLKQAEQFASDGLCALGTVVVDRRFHTNRDYEETAARLTQKGWRIGESFDALMSSSHGGPRWDETDLLLLPVPIQMHAPMSVDALEAGFDVLCEKPVAGGMEEAELMRQAAERTSRRLRFGFQHRLSKSVVTMLEMIGSGELGTIRGITGSVLWPRSEGYYNRSGWAGKRSVDGRPVLDSPIQNAGAHFLHILLEAAAAAGLAVTGVTAEHGRVHEIETADLQVLRLSTRIEGPNNHGAGRRGADLFFWAQHSSRIERPPEVRLTTDNGELIWRFPNQLLIRPRGGGERLGEEREIVSGVGGPDLNGLALRTAITDPDSGVDWRSAVSHLAVVTTAFGGADAPGFPIPPIHRQYVRVETNTAGETFRSLESDPKEIERMISERILPTEAGVPWARYLRRVERGVPAHR